MPDRKLEMIGSKQRLTHLACDLNIGWFFFRFEEIHVNHYGENYKPEHNKTILVPSFVW
jgi:hypothetical protein